MALQVAKARQWEDACKLINESSDIVSRPDKDIESYQAALAKLQKANTFDPNAIGLLGVLGTAQYRVGQYEDALETLTKADEMRSTDTDERIPDVATIASLAMTLHRLGRTEEAKVTLDRLRELCKREQFAEDAKVEAFLAEAEGLIEGEGR